MPSITWRTLRHDPSVADASLVALARVDARLAAASTPDEALAALAEGGPALVLGALVFDPHVTSDVLERRDAALGMAALTLSNAPHAMNEDRARTAVGALAALAIAESCGVPEAHVGATALGAWLAAIGDALATTEADSLGRAALTALAHGRVPRAEALLGRVGKPSATSEMARALVKVRGNVANEDRVMATALEIFPPRHAAGRGDAVAVWLAARIVFEAQGRTVREAPLELFRRVLALSASAEPVAAAAPAELFGARSPLAPVERAAVACGASAYVDPVSRVVVVTRDQADAAGWRALLATAPAAAEVATLLASGEPRDRIDGARLAGFVRCVEVAPVLRRLALTADGWTAAASAWALRVLGEPEPWAHGAAIQISVDEDEEELDLVVGPEPVAGERGEAERLARVEAERVEAERLARLEAERVEAERLAGVEAERVEAERLARVEAERVEAERLARVEAERVEAERLARVEAERLEAERVETERLEAERVEAERLEAERVERLEAERVEAERLARVEAERLEAERVEAERLARLEAERVEADRVQAERLARLEAERVEAERVEAERVEAERVQAERLARLEAERVEAERVEAERVEAERVAAEQLARLEAERVEAERVEAERLARLEAERVEAERVEAERVEAERLARLEAERVEAERVEAERVEAEQLARVEAERVEAERVEAERVEAEPPDAGQLDAEAEPLELESLAAEPPVAPELEPEPAEAEPAEAAVAELAAAAPELAEPEVVAPEPEAVAAPEPPAPEPPAPEPPAPEPPAPEAVAPEPEAVAAEAAPGLAAAEPLEPERELAAAEAAAPAVAAAGVAVAAATGPRVVGGTPTGTPRGAPVDPTNVDIPSADDDEELDLADDLEPTASPGTVIPLRSAPVDLRSLVATARTGDVDRAPGPPATQAAPASVSTVAPAATAPELAATPTAAAPSATAEAPSLAAAAAAAPPTAPAKPVNVVHRKRASDDIADEAIAALADRTKAPETKGGLPGWLVGLVVGFGLMMGCGGVLGGLFWFFALR